MTETVRFEDREGRVWHAYIDDVSGKLCFEADDGHRMTNLPEGTSFAGLSSEDLTRLLAEANPSIRVEVFRDFFRHEHAFFDELVMLLASFSSFAACLNAQAGGRVKPWLANDGILMNGARSTGLALTMIPFFVLDPLARNAWPTEIRLIETPRDEIPAHSGPVIDIVSRLTMLLAMGPFVWYFERDRSRVAANFGKNPYGWPTVWNFARVLRNALVHNEGAIHFANPTAPPVSWRNLTYGPVDNGKQVMLVDVSAVELIVLLSDMHDALTERPITPTGAA